MTTTRSQKKLKIASGEVDAEDTEFLSESPLKRKWDDVSDIEELKKALKNRDETVLV